MLLDQKLTFHCFVLFPGCEFIKPKKCNIEAITELVKVFTIYKAATGKDLPEAVSEMFASQLVIVNASKQCDGIYWRCYDTHYRVNATATGNRHLDIDLHTQFFYWESQNCSIMCFLR